MINSLLIIFGRFIAFLSKIFNLGSGSTWPGHLALSVNHNFIKDILKNSKTKIILIAGTNGKTTTGKLIQTILEKDGKKVFQNAAGANLLNGIASSLIINSSLIGKIDKDFAVFEIDENTLPLILKEINNPDYVLLLNLFRDQLDRYGEVNTITSKWKEPIRRLPLKTILILNADDPQIAYLGRFKNTNTEYFSISPKTESKISQHASDSTYCPNCNTKLTYKAIYFSHLGDWECTKCMFKHPKNSFNSSKIYPLLGSYNQYNTNAAVLLSKKIGLNEKVINLALKEFIPAFGRQEVLEINGKNVQILLSKNPISLNECLRTVSEMNAKNLLIVLNDRVPDGRDVSWIWDVDFENFVSNFDQITVSGDRTCDMGLRLKYAGYKNVKNEENLSIAIRVALTKTTEKEMLYILATYSAMLDVRRELVGKKIL